MRISDWSSDVCSSDLSVTVGKNMQMERRRFVSGALGGGAAAAMAAWFPAWAQPVSPGITAPLPTVSGNDITLRIARQTMRIDGKLSRAIGINGTVPATLVSLTRSKERGVGEAWGRTGKYR